MKSVLSCCLALVLLAMYSPAFSAEDTEASESAKLSIESIIASCEQEYTVEGYPDEEERNKMIEQCIEKSTSTSTE
jgi:hypothetical protein